MTYLSVIRTPPHLFLVKRPNQVASRTKTCHGHSPNVAALPPTILPDLTKGLTPHSVKFRVGSMRGYSRRNDRIWTTITKRTTKNLRERKSLDEEIWGLVVVSSAPEVLLSSSIIVSSVLVANVVVGLLVGLGRFVVIWGFFVVALDTVFGFGFRVVGFEGRTGFSDDTKGFEVVGRLIDGLFVVAGFFVVMYEGLVVVVGFRNGFLVVEMAGLFVGGGLDVALARLYTISFRS